MRTLAYRRSRRRIASLLALALLGPAGIAQAAPSTTVFSCRDDDGKLITSDRPIEDRAALAALDQEAAELKRRFDADAQRLRALRAAR